MLLLDPVKARETEGPTIHPECAKTRLAGSCWAEAAVDTALHPGSASRTSRLSRGAHAVARAGQSREQEAASGHRLQPAAQSADSLRSSFSVVPAAAGPGLLQMIAHWRMLRQATAPVGAGAPQCHCQARLAPMSLAPSFAWARATVLIAFGLAGQGEPCCRPRRRLDQAHVWRVPRGRVQQEVGQGQLCPSQTRLPAQFRYFAVEVGEVRGS